MVTATSGSQTIARGAAVSISHLHHAFTLGKQAVPVLENISLQLRPGESVALLGPSGCGKTTLLNMLGGLDNPTEGTVLIHGKDITKMKSEELTVYRRKHIGFVFQNYNLLQTLNVKSNILLPLYLGNSKIDEAYFEEIVEILGIKNKLKNLPNTLSGGQQQRVAIARAMITKPDIVLADEPTGNLDSESSEEVLRLLRESGERYNQTIIMITHSREIAETASRIIRMRDGKIV